MQWNRPLAACLLTLMYGCAAYAGATERLARESPAGTTERLATERLATERLATERSATERSATERSATERSAREPPAGAREPPAGAREPPAGSGVSQTQKPDWAAQRQLGRMLFFDPRLSADGSVSCATCHDAQHSYTVGVPVRAGVNGRLGSRHPPSLDDVGARTALFWDGRSPSLEEQALYPIVGATEMANSVQSVAAYVNAQAGYRDLFSRYSRATTLSSADVCAALAAFERTIVSPRSAFDEYYFGHNTLALAPAARRGWSIFSGKGNCIKCHVVSRSNRYFSDSAYHNTGVGVRNDQRDLGRFYSTISVADRGKFRTPSLRNVAARAPYMHDGSLESLAEVVDYYNQGGTPNEELDPVVKPLHLTENELSDVVSFLQSL